MCCMSAAPCYVADAVFYGPDGACVACTQAKLLGHVIGPKPGPVVAVPSYKGSFLSMMKGHRWVIKE